MPTEPDTTDVSTRSQVSDVHYAALSPHAASSPRRWRHWSAFLWCGCDTRLHLTNTYYAKRMALMTLMSLFSLSLLLVSSSGVSLVWLVFQLSNAMLGISAFPSVALYSIVPRPVETDSSRRKQTFSYRDVEIELKPFRLEESKILRICEKIVIVQGFLLRVGILLLLFILISYLELVVTGQAPLVNPFRFGIPLQLIFSLFAFICTIVQKNAFDRLRAHEQLQLGAGLDHDQIEYVHTSKKEPPMDFSQACSVLSPNMSTQSPHSENGNTFYLSTVNIEHPSPRLVEKELRRGLYEAAVHHDRQKARELLDIAERMLGSKKELEKMLHKMYATPTLWLWSFAYATHNPLHVACQLGDTEMIEVLLNGGMDPNLLDKTQGQPFSRTLLYEIVQGRRKNLTNVLGSPLHVAVTHGNLHVIDVLVRHPKTNIDILAKSSFYAKAMRVPPIFLADSTDVLESLIHHGANFLLVLGRGNARTITLLQRVMLNDRGELENVLMKWGADVALTPLHEAAAAGDIATAAHYLSLGVPPDQLGEFQDGVNRRTPLHWASIMGRSRVARVFIKYNADVNAQDSSNRTPLHWAARHGHAETVRELLRAGANPLLCDEDGLTPLAFGAAGGRLNGECVEVFGQFGVDVNERLSNVFGDTCLHLALRGGHQDAALALIKHGADLASVNTEGEPAIKCCSSAEQLYNIKVTSKWIDIVISYDSAYHQLATHVKQGIEESYLTVYMREVNANAQESTVVMREASAVVCVFTPGFEHNSICMEELAFAKQSHVPVMAITIESMSLPEELQVYLFTRQLVPFRDAITATRRRSSAAPSFIEVSSSENTREFRFKLDETKFKRSLQNLIDGLRDEVELRGRFAGRDSTVARSLLQTNVRRNSSVMSLSFLSSPQSARGLVRTQTARLWTLSEVVTDAIGSRRQTSVYQGLSVNALMRRPVFLSHGDCHKEFVAKLHKELKRNDIPVTLDSMAKVSSMKERILAAKDAILQCEIFLVVLSETSVKTELLSDQLAFAEDKGKHIVPIYFTHRPGLVDATVEQLLEANDRPMRIFGNDIGYGRGFDELLADLKREHELFQVIEEEEVEEWDPTSPVEQNTREHQLLRSPVRSPERYSVLV